MVLFTTWPRVTWRVVTGRLAPGLHLTDQTIFHHTVVQETLGSISWERCPLGVRDACPSTAIENREEYGEGAYFVAIHKPDCGHQQCDAGMTAWLSVVVKFLQRLQWPTSLWSAKQWQETGQIFANYPQHGVHHLLVSSTLPFPLTMRQAETCGCGITIRIFNCLSGWERAWDTRVDGV